MPFPKGKELGYIGKVQVKGEKSALKKKRKSDAQPRYTISLL